MAQRNASGHPARHTGLRRAALRPALEQLEDRCCPSDFTVVATGLTNPRGLTFGPDGQLYVAQGGPAANALSTAGDPTVQQVPSPIGPYTGGYNSLISRINLGVPDPVTVHRVATVVSGLPSSQTSDASGRLVSGVAAVQFLGNTLYGLEAGAGASHGLLPGDSPDPNNPAYWDNTLFRVNPDGTVTTVADLSAFQTNNPVARPNADDFEPDGTWYSMVAVRGSLYAVEPNHGELDRITPDGQISRVLDFSAAYGHVVPTAVAYHGNFYVGNLGTFPVSPGSANVYQVTPGGQTQVAASGLSAVVGVAFDARGRMYALEADTVAGFPGPGPSATSGEVVRVNGDGTLTTVASGLTFPTAMTFGPDGNLYVSNVAFGVPVAGAGQVVRIDLSPAPDQPAQTRAVVATAASQAVPFSPAPAGAAAVDQFFANLGAWLTGCTSLTGTVTESFNPGGVATGAVAFNVGGTSVQGAETFNLISSSTSGTVTNNTGVRVIHTDQGTLVLKDVSTVTDGQIAGTETVLAGTGIFQGDAGQELSLTGQINPDGTDTLHYSGCI